MRDLSQLNPTSRFSGLADTYAQHRPSYPDEAIDLMMTRCGLGGDTLLVDVGCGTGISSRLFAERGVPVLGIEPNAEMRARAETALVAVGMPKPLYQDGCADATGLQPGQAAAVLAAQAFHWFEPDAALREFHRILRPDGWVILMWNERDDRDAFTAAYSAVIRTAPDTANIEMPRGRAGTPLLTNSLFQNQERLLFHNEQVLDEEGLLGRAFSASYAPREPHQIAAWTGALRTLFAQHERRGKVVLHYETSVYLGQRRGDR
jgi:SAM-dependent methyltransferase